MADSNLLLLGIDCGGVQTQAVLTDAGGRPLVAGNAPAAADGNLEKVIQAAAAPCLEALQDRTASVALALPLAYPLDRKKIGEAMRASFPPRATVWMGSQLEAAVAGALGGKPGLVVHSGLRAAALGVEASGKVLTAGHDRTPLGDDGSALWLAVRSLKLAVQGYSGRMPRSPRLEKCLSAYFGTDSLDELMQRLDEGQVNPVDLAGFVSVVLALAGYPDPEPACRVLVLQASRHLVDLVRFVLERTRWPEEPVGSWSGIAFHGPLLESFQKEVSTSLPSMAWNAPRYSPLGGCLLLAQGGARMGTSPGRGNAPTTAEVSSIDPDLWREVFKIDPVLPAYSEE